MSSSVEFSVASKAIDPGTFISIPVLLVICFSMLISSCSLFDCLGRLRDILVFEKFSFLAIIDSTPEFRFLATIDSTQKFRFLAIIESH